MNTTREFYVYVYIDPRNFEEFYYGKGKGDRKNAHLSDSNETSEKAERIRSIKRAGFKQPIIRVIASGLTEDEAHLIEETLIWRLGHTLTNISLGHFSDKFRSRDKLYLELKGFDYNNGIFLLNVGEGAHRSWKDCQKYAFMSAGQGKRYRKIMEGFHTGDIIAAYWSKKKYRGGYVGIGRVLERAVPINEFRIGDKLLRDLPLIQKNIFDNCDDPDKSEYVIKVEWIACVSHEERKWQSRAGLFSTPATSAKLEKQIATLRFLETQFNVKFAELRK